MKKYFNNKLLLIIACSLMFFAACKKEGTNVTFVSGTAPALSSTASGSIPLYDSIKTNTAVTFSWTNPNYYFSNGISSLNVTYNLEFDTSGANFSSPHMQTVQISPALSTTYTVDALNSLLANGLQLDTAHTHQVQVKIVSFIAPYTSGSANDQPLSSNVLQFSIKPYAPPPVVAPPTSGQLFLVGGDVLLGAWSNPVPAAQAFTAVTPTDYQLTITLSGGDPTNSNADDQYLLLPVNGSWSAKFACTSTSAQPFSGGTFGLNAGSGPYTGNFPGPTAAGTYLFDVNFQTGIMTVTKQ